MGDTKNFRPKIGFKNKSAAENSIKTITSWGSFKTQSTKIKSLLKRTEYTISKTKSAEKRQRLQEAKEIFQTWLDQNQSRSVPVPETRPTSTPTHCTLMEDSLHYVNRVRGLGYKNKTIAELTLKNLAGRDSDYQKQAVNGLLNNAKVMFRKTKKPEKRLDLSQAIEVFQNFLKHLREVNQPTWRYLPATDIDKFPAPQDDLTKEFLETYKACDDYKRLRSCFPYGKYEKTWDIVRNERLKQLLNRAEDEELWLENGSPSEIHLNMIYWAYSPEPVKVKEYVEQVLNEKS